MAPITTTRFLAKIPALGILLILLGCEYNDSGTTTGPSFVTVIAKGKLVGNTTTVSLDCRSNDKFPCSNYEINTRIEKESNSFKLTFLSITKFEICATSIGPASQYVLLENLSDGKYDIELNNRTRQNKGKMIVKKGTVFLDFPSQVDIRVINN